MSNNNTSYSYLFLLTIVIGTPILFMVYSTNIGAISIIARVYATFCFVGMLLAIFVKIMKNKNEIQNTINVSNLIGYIFSKMSLTGVAVVAFLLVTWFSLPMFSKSLNDDFLDNCRNASDLTSIQKKVCNLK